MCPKGIRENYVVLRDAPIWNKSYMASELICKLFHLALSVWTTRKPASRVFLAPPEGLTKYLSSLYHAWQLLLAKFFDLVKLEFWPPGPLEPPGGQGSNLNSLFRALRWEGLPLSIWFGYYKRFPRSFKRSTVTNRPKSTRKISIWYHTHANNEHFWFGHPL